MIRPRTKILLDEYEQKSPAGEVPIELVAESDSVRESISIGDDSVRFKRSDKRYPPRLDFCSYDHEVNLGNLFQDSTFHGGAMRDGIQPVSFDIDEGNLAKLKRYCKPVLGLV